MSNEHSFHYGSKINLYKNKVYEITEFLSDTEQDYFLNIVRESTEKDWPSNVKNEFEDQEQNGTVLILDRELHSNMSQRIYNRIKTLFENQGRINHIAAIQRYKPGMNMNLHIDNQLDPSVLYGLVIYLNDDYEGGEINYPQLQLKIKPKAKSIIIHPAALQHEVLKVRGENTRYILSSFVRGDSNTRFKYGK